MNRPSAQTTVRRRAARPAAAATTTPHAVLELEQFLPYRLSVLSNRISQDIAGLYADRFGISITEWRVIAVLGRFPGLSANAVAERTAMDKVAVSRAVRALVDKDLVSQEFCGTDRRRSELTLSRRGFRIFDEIVPLALAYQHELLAAFAPGEQALFLALLAKIEAAELSIETGPVP